MKIISHRGNLKAKDSDRENKPFAIDECIRMGIDVEVDFWLRNGKFYLGHDKPETEIEETFLLSRKKHLWIHAKNFEAVECLSFYSELNWFWHEEDKMTLTSKGIPWCYPGYRVSNGITVVMDERTDYRYYGICTDNPIGFLS